MAKICQRDRSTGPLASEQGTAVRLLNVAQTYYPYLAEGGRPTKVRILSRKLADRGHNVTVLTANLGLPIGSRIVEPTEKTAMGLRTTEDRVVAIYLPTWARYRTLTINPGVLRFCRMSLKILIWSISTDSTTCSDLRSVIFAAVWSIPYFIEPMGMYRPIDRGIQLKRHMASQRRQCVLAKRSQMHSNF